jgi:plastocyanin
MHRKKMLAPIAVVAVVAAAALAGFAQAREPEATITVGNNFLSPSSKTISSGTKLRFKWAGGVRHHIVKREGPGGDIRSPATSKRGVNLAHVFNKRGAYRFVCTIHPTEMRLKLKVVGQGGHG